MELLNDVTRFEDSSAQGRVVVKEALDTAVLLLSPIIPHVTHTLWTRLGHTSGVIDERWPVADESALKQDTIELVVQVNGKLRGRVEVDAGASESNCEAVARADENVSRHLDGKTERKVIVVPGQTGELRR